MKTNEEKKKKGKLYPNAHLLFLAAANEATTFADRTYIGP